MVDAVDRMLDVRTNSITPFLRVRMRLSGAGVDVSWTQTVLGLIPLRRRSASCPDRAKAWLGPRFFPDRALFSLLALAVALSASGWLKAIVGVVAGVTAILSVVMVLNLPEAGGSTARVPVCWLHRRRITDFLREDG